MIQMPSQNQPQKPKSYQEIRESLLSKNKPKSDPQSPIKDNSDKNTISNQSNSTDHQNNQLKNFTLKFSISRGKFNQPIITIIAFNNVSDIEYTGFITQDLILETFGFLIDNRIEDFLQILVTSIEQSDKQEKQPNQLLLNITITEDNCFRITSSLECLSKQQQKCEIVIQLETKKESENASISNNSITNINENKSHSTDLDALREVVNMHQQSITDLQQQIKEQAQLIELLQIKLSKYQLEEEKQQQQDQQQQQQHQGNGGGQPIKSLGWQQNEINQSSAKWGDWSSSKGHFNTDFPLKMAKSYDYLSPSQVECDLNLKIIHIENTHFIKNPLSICNVMGCYLQVELVKLGRIYGKGIDDFGFALTPLMQGDRCYRCPNSYVWFLQRGYLRINGEQRQPMCPRFQVGDVIEVVVKLNERRIEWYLNRQLIVDGIISSPNIPYYVGIILTQEGSKVKVKNFGLYQYKKQF